MPEEKLARLKKSLNPDLAEKMLKSRSLQLFERIVSGTKADATLVAATLEETLVSLRREGVPVENIGDAKLLELFAEYEKGLFVKAAIPEIIRLLAGKPDAKVAQLVKEGGFSKLSGKELEAAVEKELASVQDRKKAVGAVMAKLRLRADAEEVMKLIRKKA
jgi:glutamyl-tRNA(Gln) amidotransferase subunit E